MDITSLVCDTPSMSDPEKTIPAGEFKQTCLRLIDEVQTTGLRIVITKRGRPVAQVVPLEPKQCVHHWPTELAAQGSMSDDLLAPAEEAESWEALRR